MREEERQGGGEGAGGDKELCATRMKSGRQMDQFLLQVDTVCFF